MRVRGAPLIGAVAAFGLALALRSAPSDAGLAQSLGRLAATRPTAVNLFWALERVRAIVQPASIGDRAELAWQEALAIVAEDRAINKAIGRHGLAVLRTIADKVGRNRPVAVLTHCNAGRLATLAWGTATAPIYQAQRAGIDVMVWVDETRPRNQGAALTAWELGQAGVPHRVITDNAGGHLMQRGLVDWVITGADRVTSRGDVCNKIGTYLKALAARDNGIQFHVAVPRPTIDMAAGCGLRDIAIEERSSQEVTHVHGMVEETQTIQRVRIVPEGVQAANPAFDVTPARLVSGLITECGVIPAEADSIAAIMRATAS